MLLKNRVVKNSLWIISCRIAQALINLIVTMISARYLGPSNYGIISYAASIVAFIVPLVQLGLRNTIVQELVGSPETEGKTLGTIIYSTCIMSFLGMLGVTCFTLVADFGEWETILVCALYSISLLFQMSEMIQYWFQAKLISKYISVVSLATYALMAVYKVYILMTGKSIYWFAVSHSIEYLIITIALFVIYKKLGGQRLSYSFSLLKVFFKKSKYYILAGLMVTVFSQTDKIMLKLMINEAETGFYSAASVCAGMTSFVFVAIIDSFRPVIFEGKKKASPKYETNVSRLFSVVFYLGLMQSLVLMVLSPLAVNILYGADYSPTINILRISTWFIAFSYMGTVRNIWILAEGKQKYIWQIDLAGAVINVAGNLILIPLWGACGAAVASVATQFITNFVLCFIMKPIKPCSKLILKSLNPMLLLSLLKKEI